jgi:hypothetical protein
MVKNSTGGNKSKKGARKNIGLNSGGSNQDVRRVADPCEMYAAVTKIYSSRRCDVMGTDGLTYQCNVRGKFLKSKRGGNGGLAVGVWILIGFYEWEVRGDGSKTCDLLEIYTPIEKDKLKQLEAHNLAAIMNIGELAGAENEFIFSKFKDEEINDESKSKAVVDDDSSSGEEEIEKEKPVVVAHVKKETLAEQMDWLTINERDI